MKRRDKRISIDTIDWDVDFGELKKSVDEMMIRYEREHFGSLENTQRSKEKRKEWDD